MALVTTAETGRSSPDDKTGIGYAVDPLSLRDTADPQTFGHSVHLVVDGADATPFKYEMLGYARLDGTDLHRVLPEPSGRDASCYCLKLESVQHIPDPIEDVVDPEPGEPSTVWAVNEAGWPTYQIERYQATFVKPLYKVLEDDEVDYEHQRFCVWRKRVVSQNEKIPGGSYRWVDDLVDANRTKINEVGVKTGRTIELTCKWLDVPKFDYAIIASVSNSVNESAITLDGVEYPAETVLFTGCEEEPKVNAVGEASRDITFTFAVRADGRTWNMFWKNGDDKYVEVSHNGLSTGNKVFDKNDLNVLWTFSP